MATNRITTVPTHTWFSAPTAADQQALTNAWLAKFKLLIRESTLIRVTTGLAGEGDWDAADTTALLGTNAHQRLGWQIWKLGGDRAAQEPLYFRIYPTIRRNSGYLQMAPYIEVGTFDEVAKVGTWTGYDFASGATSMNMSAYYDPELRMCVRDNSVTFIFGPSVISGQNDSGGRGWLHAARSLEYDGAMSKDPHLLTFGSTASRITTGYWNMRAMRHTEGVWKQYDSTYATTLFGHSNTASTGAKVNYTAAYLPVPLPQYAKNLMAAYTADVALDRLHQLKMIDGTTGTFLALSHRFNASTGYIMAPTLSNATGKETWTVPLLRWE
jgi:hypothetical protein